MHHLRSHHALKQVSKFHKTEERGHALVDEHYQKQQLIIHCQGKCPETVIIREVEHHFLP
jgi:hypothetical protein